MKIGLVVSASILLLIFASIADACSCGRSPTVCESYAAVDGVFIGTVQNVENQTRKDGKGREYIAGQTAQVQVEKVFKGIKETEAIFRSGGTSCDVQYKEGQRWLFYAHYNKESRTWGIGGCGRSTSIESAADDLLYLQGLPATAQKTRISGTLTNPAHQPIIGTKVNLSGERKSYEVYTDKNGVYEIYGLPPGKYSIKPEIPLDLKVRYSVSSEAVDYTDRQTIQILLKEKSCAGVDFYFSDNTSISGTIFGADGRALPSVCLRLSRKENPPAGEVLIDCTDGQGHYKIDEISPGEYLMVANDDGKISGYEPFPTAYYPGVFEKEKATVLTVTNGDRLENYDIHIPSQEATRVIQGVVLYSDGHPAADLFVEFKAETVKEGYDGEVHTKTDAQGRFSLTVLHGLKGWLRGFMYTYEGQYVNCPQLDKLIKATGRSAPDIGTKPIRLEVNREFSDTRLVFPFPYCVKSKVE